MATTNMYTDESSAYAHIAKQAAAMAPFVIQLRNGLVMMMVTVSARFIHNTMEGIWTGCETFCARFGYSQEISISIRCYV